MNFLFLNSSRNWGGNETWTHLAANTLAKNHVVHLAYRSDRAWDRFTLPRHQLPFLNEVDPITISRLAKLIRDNHFEVLIPTKRKDYVLAGIAAKLTGARSVLRLGIVRHLQNNSINRLIYGQLCDGIIVNSEAIRAGLLESGLVSPDKICVIHNGIPFESIQSKAAAENGYDKPFEFMVSSLGELSGRKGFDHLIRGFNRFLSQSDNRDRYGLLLIGGGDINGIRNLSRSLNIEGQVILTGFQDNPYPYVKQSDLFVLASRNEGMPNAILEAMTLKIPVISTRFEGSNEIIEDGSNGFIVDPSDENDLAARILKLAHDQNERQRISESAFQRVSRQFTLEKMGAEIARFCQNILNQSE